jgi:hypothetical protein
MIALLILCFAVFFSPVVAAQQQTDPELKEELPEELEITEVLFEDYDGWIGPRLDVEAGSNVVLSFRVEGFQRLPVRAGSGLREHRVHLSHHVELRDPLGVLVAPGEEGEIDTILGPRDEEWKPKINWSATVPSSAPGGDYQVEIRVTDRIAERDTRRRVTFRVRGEAIRPSDTLEIQRLEYARSERGPWFPSRTFSIADRIWARYKIVGYRVSPENQVWVEQDLAVLDAEDQVVISQLNASVQRDQSFYPPRFLPTVFEVELEDPQPGEYRLQVNVRDRIGHQSSFIESKFSLRP